jgi:MipA family protein
MSKFLATASLALLVAAPARAQSDEDRNQFTLGLGAVAIPSYEGSDKYNVFPTPYLQGSVAGFDFQTVGTNLFVDLWRDGSGDIEVQLGPVIGVNLNRIGQIGDSRVKALGELDPAIEAGAYIGIAKNRVFADTDQLRFTVSYQKDLSDVHDSSIVRPEISYFRVVNPKTAVQFSIGAEIAGQGYATTYFGVSPQGAVASGLPAYQLDGGLKDLNLTFFATRAIKGDLRGGWSLFGAFGYTRLVGDFADSPVVDTAGSADQIFGLFGVAYTF